MIERFLRQLDSSIFYLPKAAHTLSNLLANIVGQIYRRMEHTLDKVLQHL